MEAVVECCAGLDVHQGSVVACVLLGAAGRKPRKEVRTFATATADLVALRDWLEALGVTHVGMESTGVYWKPVYAVLEGRFELIVGNAHHSKAVPGRKTDVKDAEWIADLVRHGLARASFVPPPAIRELRDLVRLRRSLSEGLTTDDPPPLKWSVLRYGFEPEEDRDGEEEGAHARGDRGQAAPGGRAGFAGSERR
jgi:transposase